jgi:23S rRNA (uracil1939-C5)-methyltransferase
MGAGGDAIARTAEGKVVFVTGALPGERVRAQVTAEKKDLVKARVVEVVEPSPLRVAPPCGHLARGCGGCSWQHVTPAGQRDLKRAIVVDSLRRLGRIPDAPVDAVVPLPAHGYRTTVRFAITDGLPGFRRASSHEIVDVDSCLVVHPLLQPLVASGRFGGATEVELRCGARTGDRLAVADPTAARLELPDDVVRAGTDELDGGADVWFTERVAGRLWRISALSFFQIRPDGADVLAELVLRASAGASTAVDLFSGVGLFAGVLGAAGCRVTAVEGSASSVADARHNLADVDATVVESDVLRWQPRPADLVVADPSRSGLGRRGVEVVAGVAAGRIVLVSCDPASLGRDAGLLAAAGYRLERVTPVDLFPHTPHIETVSVFERTVAA